MASPEVEKAKPVVRHALIQGLLALVVAFFLASSESWDLIGRTTMWILNAIGVGTGYISPPSLMYVKLRDGALVGFQVLIECSGLVAVATFSLIYTFTIGLLEGSILKKIVWFFLSVGVGLTWNINRLVLVILIAYNFGLSAFSFIHYIIGPFIDFLWVVAMWSLGMSWLKGGRET